MNAGLAPDAVTLRDRLIARELSCREVAFALIEDISADQHRAWAAADGELLLQDAAVLDGLRDDECAALPLFGIPVAIKDNFDTAALPTAYGSPIYAGHRPAADAEVVTRLRAAGALIAGKARCTEFAWMHPTDTRNPVARDRTPGGSSSGSAALVSEGTVPLATGSQTAGSINRPASYCGVFGLKPTFGLLSCAGVKPLAESLDTVGLFAPAVRDLRVALAALTGTGAGGPPHAVPPVAGSGRPRIGFARTSCWDSVEPEARRAIERTVAHLELPEVSLPPGFEDLVRAQRTIHFYEAARALAPERARHADLLSEWLRGALDEAAAISADAYAAARRAAAQQAPGFVELLASHAGILTPSTTGVPPLGLASTGDPLFCRVWTLIGAPSISLPLACRPDGLPVGLQLVGAPGRDHELLLSAEWVMASRL